jgi:hypothetical protein
MRARVVYRVGRMPGFRIVPVADSHVVNREGGLRGSRKDHAVLKTRSRSGERRNDAPLAAPRFRGACIAQDCYPMAKHDGAS